MQTPKIRATLEVHKRTLLEVAASSISQETMQANREKEQVKALFSSNCVSPHGKIRFSNSKI